MDTPLLIIINGIPGTGKTTLARRLAPALQLPLLCKDDLKEILFDVLGWQDRAWSQKLGHASFRLLYHLMEGQLQAGNSIMVETAFMPQFDAPRFLALKERVKFEPFQIFCKAETQTLIERFMKRAASEARHPGHVDHLLTEAQLREGLQSGKYGPLAIGGTLYELDMTDFARIDYEGLQNSVREKLLHRL